MAVPAWVRAFARRAGYELQPLARTHGAKYRQVFAQHHINLLLDVGAYVGDYARSMRRLPYAGRIVSFEPAATAFAQLQARAQADPHWTAVNLALGDHDGQATLNISGLPMSSSLLPMLPAHVNAAPTSAFVGSETVTVRTLDSVFGDYFQPGNRVFLKLDTQGFERAVLTGAARSLPNILGMQIELSFVPLYSGEATIGPMVDYLAELGFGLRSFSPGFEDGRGRLLQVYALLARDPAA
jgi:FkbM family methyltransferase